MKRILFLDGFRAIAILLVVAFHYFHVFVKKYSNEELAPFSFSFGGVGVDLFFMISGFVIFMTVTRKSLKGFFISRLTRLFPVYIFSVCVTTLVILNLGDWYSDVSLVNFLKNLTMFQYYLGGSNIDGVYWSLRVEVAFYIGLAVVSYGCSQRFLWPIILMISISSFTFNFIAMQFTSLPIYLDLLHKVSISHFIPYFIIGMCVYVFGGNSIGKIDFKSKDTQVKLLSLLIAIFDLLVNKNQLQFFVVFVAGAILLGMCRGRLVFLKVVLVSKLLVFFGIISYSLYLVHQVIGYILIHILVDAGIELYLAIALVFLFVVALAYFMQKYIESFISGVLFNKLNSRFLSYAK